MKKLKKLIYSNKVICVLSILLQFAVLIFVTFTMSAYVNYIYRIMSVFSALLIIYEINRDEEPGFKLTWILLVAAMPIFGVIFYIFLHRNGISRKIASKSDFVRNEYSVLLRRGADDIKTDIETIEREAPDDVGIVKYLTRHCGFPVCGGTEVKYYPLGDDMFDDMKDALKNAKKFIFIEMFIINPSGRMWNETLEILKQKAAEGVEVRLMYDGMGCLTLLPSDYAERLEKYGIKCCVFAPIVPFFSTYQNNRDHRKIIIADGEICFTGGVNLADEYINERERFGHWKDTAVRLTGKAAAGFTCMFMQTWTVVSGKNDADPKKYIIDFDADANADADIKPRGFVVPVADSPLRDERFGSSLYINILNIAKDHVYIMTPYLAIGAGMIDAIKNAAKRGVDVRLILPHIPDKAYAFWLSGTYYRELLRSGVKIYEYKPGFVHAKMSLSDGCRAVVGTINHDYRSLYLNYECAAYMFGVPQIADIERDFRETLAKCICITEEDFLRRSVPKRLAGRIIRLLAPLM